jgi:hypothetical protein
MDCETEGQAVAYVRRLLPDAVAMPVPVAIGSGQTFLLGIVADGSRRIDPDGEIPFALCVQAVAQNDADRHRAKKGPVFDRLLWKVKPVCPELAQSYKVELRASDLDVPAYVDAKVGHHNGKLVIYVELGGIEMSLGFDDPELVIKTGAPDDDAVRRQQEYSRGRNDNLQLWVDASRSMLDGLHMAEYQDAEARERVKLSLLGQLDAFGWEYTRTADEYGIVRGAVAKAKQKDPLADFR